MLNLLSSTYTGRITGSYTNLTEKIFPIYLSKHQLASSKIRRDSKSKQIMNRKGNISPIVKRGILKQNKASESVVLLPNLPESWQRPSRTCF
jgi:hypothetical protein